MIWQKQMFLALRLCLGIMAGLLVLDGSAQVTEDVYLTEGNDWQWQTQPVYSQPNVIQEPDSAIGTLDVTLLENQIVLEFHSTGISGTTDAIIEYFPLPYAPTQKHFRFIVAPSHVRPEKDYYVLQKDTTSAELDVLANDFFSTGSFREIRHIPIVNRGSATIDTSGKHVLFTPEPGFAGMAYFSYVACDSLGACGKAEVAIRILDNAVPEQDTIRLMTRSTEPVVAFVPADSFQIVNPPAHGNMHPVSPVAWQYASDPQFAGQDTFILAKNNLTRVVIVQVFYKEEPNTHAFDDVVFTYPNTPVTFDVLDNDIKKYPIDAFTLPDEGALTLDSFGIFTYVPDTDFEGAVTFEYTTCFNFSCESASVTVLVGDLAPDNHKTYQLVTPENVSLVINYAVPLKDFQFIIHEAPSFGDLTYFPGQSSLSIDCDTVSGENLLVYTPENDFTGDDAFELFYAIDGGDPHLIKVDVEVRDMGVQYDCHCIDQCVWPGDANANGQVDMLDLLTMGWHVGDIGDDRYYPDNTMWFGQYADDWQAIQPFTGMNAKYIDSDGDGVVTEVDKYAIAEHYLKRHDLVPGINALKSAYPFEIIPLFNELDSGDLAVFEIALGNASSPAIDLHGLNFTLNLPTDLVDSSSVDVDFYNNCWLAMNHPSTDLVLQPWDGRVDAGFTRIGGIPATGFGAVSTLSFIIEEDIIGIRPAAAKIPLRVSLSNAYGLDNAGRYIKLPDAEAEILVNLDIKSADLPPLEQRLILFPNPADTYLQVHLNGKHLIRSVEIYGLTGQQLTSIRIEDDQARIPVDHLREGFYVLRAITTEGVVSKKFEVIR